MKQTKIGLFGFGVVGTGIYTVLKQKPQLGAVIEKIVIKHPNKKRNAPSTLFSVDANTILEDDTIDLVIELIDDADVALSIVTKAIKNGKSVISANKKMIAEHILTLIQIAQQNNVSFLYEAAVCGSVPIIRNLEEYFNNDLITNITGIINGSTNYILTQMTQHKLEYSVALHKAQELGFAESNPELDVNGWDARDKLKIIILHAFGKHLKNKDIFVKGICSITKFDIEFAQEKGYNIKLIATCKINTKGDIKEASVLPTFVPKFHPLQLTHNEFNGVLIGGELTDEQFLYGKGAGMYPTSSAVLSDISAYLFGYKYEYKKNIQILETLQPVEKTFYIRFKKEININWKTFGNIEETYTSNIYCYVVLIGRIDIIVPLSIQYDISIISYIE